MRFMIATLDQTICRVRKTHTELSHVRCVIALRPALLASVIISSRKLHTRVLH